VSAGLPPGGPHAAADPVPPSTPSGAARADVEALGCAKCGGALEVRESAVLFRCAYCGTCHLASSVGGEARLVVPARIGRTEAERTVRGRFSDPSCPADLSASATRIASELLYVPFWRFRATFVGSVHGTKEIVSRRPIRTFHGSEEGGGGFVIETEPVRVGEETVDEELQQIWRATVSACPLEDLGIPSLSSRRQLAGGLARLTAGAGDLPGLALLGSNPRGGTLLDPMIPIEEARREADRLFERFVETRGAELRDREIAFERLQDRCSLLFYPVYRIRFQYRRRLYEGVVDGIEGRLVRAVLPASRAGELRTLVLLAGAGGAVTGLVLRWILRELTRPGGLDAPALSGAALVTLAALSAAAVAARALVRRFLEESHDVVLSA